MERWNGVGHAADAGRAGRNRFVEPLYQLARPKQNSILRMQGAAGNQATLRLLRTTVGDGGRSAPERRFEISQKGDRCEMEAERVAATVMRSLNSAESAVPRVDTHAPPLAISRVTASPAPVQRQACACEGSGTPCPDCEEKLLQRSESPDSAQAPWDRAGSAVGAVLGSPGHPLDSNTRSLMEPRFGHDFGGVRIHTDAQASESAQGVNARAYTVGRHIVFGNGEYAPQSETGRRLLAHELTHTVQQRELNPSAGGALTLARQDHSGTGAHQQSVSQSETIASGCSSWNNCSAVRPTRREGRRTAHLPNLRLPGYDATTTGPHISGIEVTIHANRLSTVDLTWQNVPSGQRVPGTLHASPGAGLCSTDCSDRAGSQVSGSCCTPLSPPTYHVQGYDCHLAGHTAATFVTWFKRDRDIAFHYLGVPSHPHSHGCVRMSRPERGAEWIHDNSIAGVTTVTVNRDPAEGPGPMCYEHLSDEEPVRRPRPHGHGHGTEGHAHGPRHPTHGQGGGTRR